MLNTYCPTRRLRSSVAGLLVKPETSYRISDRAFFAVAAATKWNQVTPVVNSLLLMACMTTLCRCAHGKVGLYITLFHHKLVDSKKVREKRKKEKTLN